MDGWIVSRGFFANMDAGPAALPPPVASLCHDIQVNKDFLAGIFDKFGRY